MSISTIANSMAHANEAWWKVADKVVNLGMLASLLTKFSLLLVAYRVYVEIPLEDPFFPNLLQTPFVYLTAYLLALLLTCAAVVCQGMPGLLLGIRLLTVVSLYILCIHQGSYNDVTFLTCFWTSLWQAWLAGQVYRQRWGELRERSITLAHLFLSMIFLGGAVGKLTPGYWSGEVLYNIYFVDREFWVFNWLRGQFDESTLRTIACVYSRFIVVAELACSMLWCMPVRWASWISLMTLIGIATFSNWLLFSVVSCLIGLSVAGLIPESKQEVIDGGPHPSDPRG